MWLAPNLITLLGFSFVVMNVLIMLVYNPTFDQECPSWVYASYAVGLFLYQTFDSCDGIQARRTGQSGPLGELFDHCVDACNTTLGVLVFASATNLGYGWEVIIAQAATLFNFYLSTWEEYHTGVLFLSMFSGPVEGILIVVAVFIVTAFKGPFFWHTELFDFLGIEDSSLVNALENTPLRHMTLNHAYLAFAAVGLGFNIFQASQNVYKSKKKQGLPLAPAFVQTLPFFTFYATLSYWIYLSPDMLYYHVLPLAVAIGAVFAFTVGKMITAHLTKQAFPIWNVLQLIPAVGIVIHYVARFNEWDMETTDLASVWTCIGFAFAVYGCFIGDIITEITTYLDIGCLYIKHPIQQKKDQ
jgi:phosphatidylglycerophosphate synthase